MILIFNEMHVSKNVCPRHFLKKLRNIRPLRNTKQEPLACPQHLRSLLCFALRIPTAHDFFASSARGGSARTSIAL